MKNIILSIITSLIATAIFSFSVFSFQLNRIIPNVESKLKTIELIQKDICDIKQHVYASENGGTYSVVGINDKDIKGAWVYVYKGDHPGLKNGMEIELLNIRDDFQSTIILKVNLVERTEGERKSTVQMCINKEAALRLGLTKNSVFPLEYRIKL